ncbi:TonB-dependent receptor [Stakelama sp. CBK3Z-3]|uniref:TonB-dependent receptor n=1 Tax=Stakelama flava TaxID=2860338 RepID=A0ABS6XJK9_9SPHN|nr:TonB-dependent receptor [Stakelama flava]MBW4330397.1 TonB-dependent receptor [Stakelama flava]
MRSFHARAFSRLVVGASTLAIAAVPLAAHAQDVPASSTMGQPGDSEIQNGDDQADTDTTVTTQPVQASGAMQPADAAEDIVVTGIRASLRNSMNIKRESQGVVDAISAEDIGKFPDTNLAESLQRITGVSIDRNNGEGSLVTVRGFGPEFNLVLLNGRQMPTSSIGDGFGAPSSRSFDFANLASEGVKALEVYKSGRATVETGGIGSTINILTPRPFDKPGLRGSFAAKGILDTSRNGKDPVTPEISGIISDTFADDRIGVLLVGNYSRRKASTNSANISEWRDGYLGSENNWGSLPTPTTLDGDGNVVPDPRYDNITNRPGPDDVYQVPQGASYNLNDIDRERINGQAVLQFKPIDSLTATIDYTYSRYELETHNSNVGIYYNHADTSSAWGDGPIADPIFYSEHFPEEDGKDLAYSGSLTKVKNENKSLGGNLQWEAPGGVTITLDAHHSTATSKPGSKYGNSQSVATAIFGVEDQSINFENDFPVISASFYPGIDPLDASQIHATGNVFRNSYFRDRINQVQLSGHYDHQGDFLDSIDWGVSYVDNKVRSAYGYIQNDTWGGLGGENGNELIPDDIFTLESIADKFPGLDGVGTDGMISQFYSFDFGRLVPLLDDQFGICGGDNNCLSPYTTDRRIREKTLAPFVQVATSFDVVDRPAHLIAGVRYEETTIDSAALVPTPAGTQWVSANEFNVVFSDDSEFTRFKGSYHNWLPAIDFDIEPIRNVKLRASYSHTITRASYADLQGGRTIDQLFRIANGTGSQGNPGLLPYKSKNIDLSAEWYYGPSSYISVGYFHKDVSNFVGSDRINTTAFGLTNPGQGPRADAARAALGSTATSTQIREYIATNYPDTVSYNDNGDLLIAGLPEDDPLNFQISQPVNSDQTAALNGWEFAIQHSFWETGFGVILNYTIVNGDAKYDNTQPASVTQFALTGLSDSANAVVFYDKGPLQARVAYNWRDEFLQSTGPNPAYIEPYGQVDASASYEFLPGITVFGEAINLTGESRRGHTRSDAYVTFISPGYARYSAGVRYAF